MNFLMTLFTTVFMSLSFSYQAMAGGGGGVGEKFVKQIYVSSAGKVLNTGTSYAAAKPCQVGTGALASLSTASTLWSIPANVAIQKAYMVIDTAVASTTAIDIGDDDDDDGFVPTAALTLATPGMYGFSSQVNGAYLKALSSTASVDNAKYYTVGTKSVKMKYTAGGCSAGKFRVVLEGMYLGAK